MALSGTAPLFVIKGIAKATMGEIIRGILPYVVLLLAGLVIVLLFPQTAMWLPDIAGFGR
jgi:C4-dicarboxylate transporter DctM subunit